MAARSSCPAPSLLHACRRAPRGYRSPALRAASDDDFVTGVLAKLFGRAAVDDPAPLGLARMTVEEWPDQWPANVDEDATLLSDDVGEIAFLRPLLKQTQLERLPLALAYDADAHGWSEDAFHRRLDGQGAALLVLETEAGTLCGGYNSKGWLGYGDWRDAISAFLFAWPAGPSDRAEKLPKVGGSGMAIIDEQGGGPQWGPDGLKVDLSSRRARSRLGTYYARRKDGSKTLFSEAEGTGPVPLSAVRVYVGLGESAKASAYAPNALQFQGGELERLRKDDDAGR